MNGLYSFGYLPLHYHRSNCIVISFFSLPIPSLLFFPSPALPSLLPPASLVTSGVLGGMLLLYNIRRIYAWVYSLRIELQWRVRIMKWVLNTARWLTYVPLVLFIWGAVILAHWEDKQAGAIELYVMFVGVRPCQLI